MAEAGIFTAEQEKLLASWLDELVKLKGLWEIVDGYVFKAILTLLDDKVIDKLKDDLKAKLAALVDAAFAKDIPLAEQLATDILVGLVQIPGIDSEVEGIIFAAVIQFAVAAILSKIQVENNTKIKLTKVAAGKLALVKKVKKTPNF
jgi:hypothetical protein